MDAFGSTDNRVLIANDLPFKDFQRLVSGFGFALRLRALSSETLLKSCKRPYALYIRITGGRHEAVVLNCFHRGSMYPIIRYFGFG